MAKTYTLGNLTFQREFYGRGSVTDVALEALFNQGVVSNNALSEITHELLARKLSKMVADGHPVGASFADKSQDKVTESVSTLLPTEGVLSLLSMYHEEHAVEPSVKLGESHATRNLVEQACRVNMSARERAQQSGLYQDRADELDALSSDSLGFDAAVLRKSLPRLAESAYEEAIQLVKQVTAEHAKAVTAQQRA